MTTRNSHTVKKTVPSPCPWTTQECRRHTGDATTASWARTGDHSTKTAVSMFENTEFNEDSRDTKTTNTNDGGKLDHQRKPYRAPEYLPQEMRYRAGELPVSIGNRLDESQGRSTSIENNVAPATGKYGMFTVEQKVEEGIPAGAAAPLARLARREPSTMHDHSASRLRENFTFSAEHQDRDIERIGNQDITSTTRQAERTDLSPQLLVPTDETPCRGSDVGNASLTPLSGVVSQSITTKRQFVKISDRWGILKPLDWILRAFRSPGKSSEGIIPFFNLRSDESSTYTQLPGPDAPDKNSASPPPNEKSPHLRIQQSNSSKKPPRYLYLCVNKHNAPRFTQIDCSNMTNDHDFFKELMSSYDSTRGRVHRLLSIRQYHHCEFYLFGKWGIDMGGPLDKHSFPPQGDPSYVFTPRPAFENLPHGPIAPQEFYDRYYRSDGKHWDSPGSSGTSSSTTTTTTTITPNPSDSALKSIPLRTAALDWENGRYETFYGLLAVEQLCYSRLKLYFALLAVFLMFSGLLLYCVWGRGMEDLQNALTPLQVALAAWPIVVNLFS